MTSSPLSGTPAPGAPPELDAQVDAEDHGPEATEYNVAEKLNDGSSNEKRKKQKIAAF